MTQDEQRPESQASHEQGAKQEARETAPPRPGFLSVVQSVLAAIFGIQSDKNREKDFKSGDASQFIVVGIVAVVVIMVTMMIIVNQVLDSAATP